MNFSISEENYIKGIYHLQSGEELVNTNSLAVELNTKAASVTDMLKKLKNKKLIQYQRYHGFKLNDHGNRVALNIIRRHRLWEFFLVSKLGFEWDKVHEIAEDLEHVSSPELVKKLDSYLGNPTIDPHGDPIPDINGKVRKVPQVDLYILELNKTATVSAVGDQSPEIMDLLNHHGINLGSKLKVIKAFDFDGSREIKIMRKASFIISAQVAKNIFVYDEKK